MLRPWGEHSFPSILSQLWPDCGGSLFPSPHVPHTQLFKRRREEVWTHTPGLSVSCLSPWDVNCWSILTEACGVSRRHSPAWSRERSLPGSWARVVREEVHVSVQRQRLGTCAVSRHAGEWGRGWERAGELERWLETWGLGLGELYT